LFGVYAAAYVLLSFRLLRSSGLPGAIVTILRGLVILILVWGLLAGFHPVAIAWTNPAAWGGTYRLCPSAKLGLAMAVAAQPVPLLLYLLALWPILPGSKEVLIRAFSPGRRIADVLAIVFGTVVVFFHLYMLFVGYLWE